MTTRVPRQLFIFGFEFPPRSALSFVAHATALLWLVNITVLLTNHSSIVA